jgi:putative transposase
MKKTRFTEDQMVTILREADEKSVPEVAKKHGVSAQTIYGWRKHYGTLEPADVQRLRQLEHENVRLKKLVADLTVDIDILKEVNRKKMVGARVRRQQVAYVQTRGRSCRRACALLSVARSSVGYVSKLATRDAPAVAAMRVCHAFCPIWSPSRVRLVPRRPLPRVFWPLPMRTNSRSPLSQGTPRFPRGGNRAWTARPNASRHPRDGDRVRCAGEPTSTSCPSFDSCSARSCEIECPKQEILDVVPHALTRHAHTFADVVQRHPVERQVHDRQFEIVEFAAEPVLRAHLGEPPPQFRQLAGF